MKGSPPYPSHLTLNFVRACRIRDALLGYERAVKKQRAPQVTRKQILSAIKGCRGRDRILDRAIDTGCLRQGVMGIYKPREMDPGARRVFERLI
jgi:hypothetical protein